MEKQDYLILIVDDEPANVYLLSRMLCGSYRIAEARSGEEALAIARSDDKPALILLDVMMPEIDGFEVCRRLKADENTKDIIIIFVTAIGDSAAEEVGLNLGAADYITKPISLPIVRARVHNQINMRRKADMLEAMSYIDGLTHVYNRRKFDILLHNEWLRARHTGKPLALIMIDFDHFKALNDHYGHGAGDVCLQQGAAALGSVLKRHGDLLARYGGEEFVALLPETDLHGAQVTAQDMRMAVKALRLAHQYSSAADHVTVSLGVAAAVPDDQHRATFLLELADRALNRAKSAGRDRIMLMDQSITDTSEANAASLSQPAWEVPEPEVLNPPGIDCERRRHGDTGLETLPGSNAVLSALSDLYQWPLSTDQRAELDHLFNAVSRLLEQRTNDLPTQQPTGGATTLMTQNSQQGVAPAADHEPEQERFDLVELLRRLGEDRDIAAATVEQFLMDAPQRLLELRAALEAGNLEGLHFKAHSLKGLAGAVSAPKLQWLSEQLEKQKQPSINTAELVEQIEQEYALLEPRLHEEFNLGPAASD